MYIEFERAQDQFQHCTLVDNTKFGVFKVQGAIGLDLFVQDEPGGGE